MKERRKNRNKNRKDEKQMEEKYRKNLWKIYEKSMKRRPYKMEDWKEKKNALKWRK